MIVVAVMGKVDAEYSRSCEAVVWLEMDERQAAACDLRLRLWCSGLGSGQGGEEKEQVRVGACECGPRSPFKVRHLQAQPAKGGPSQTSSPHTGRCPLSTSSLPPNQMRVSIGP
jgi:hypothetical protein